MAADKADFAFFRPLLNNLIDEMEEPRLVLPALRELDLNGATWCLGSTSSGSLGT